VHPLALRAEQREHLGGVRPAVADEVRRAGVGEVAPRSSRTSSLIP
jgi:hypothetical protein